MVLRCTIWRVSQIPDTGLDKVRIEMAERVVSAHGPFRWLLQLIVNGVGHGAALYSAGSAAGLVDQGLLGGFAVLPLLALFGAVGVSRLLVPRSVYVGCGLAAAVLSGCRGWWVVGLRHGAPSE
jgi:hypothetical protein